MMITILTRSNKNIKNYSIFVFVLSSQNFFIIIIEWRNYEKNRINEVKKQ